MGSVKASDKHHKWSLEPILAQTMFQFVGWKSSQFTIFLSKSSVKGGETKKLSGNPKISYSFISLAPNVENQKPYTYASRIREQNPNQGGRLGDNYRTEEHGRSLGDAQAL